ncbi:MAG: aminoglycoside phosphotransferase family protein [Desulfobulbaceae bacterium]|jgi:Ser/Thr protein kinase RdoA (MazF antagonist)|nr:aminoglycoside phosphotransferase family protein [Desulfobulbaceae bacterium]
MDELAAVIAAYFPPGQPVTARELVGGNINRGFVLDDGGRPLVVQRINPAVFPDPHQVVANFAVLASHLAERDFLVAKPVSTLGGDDSLQMADGALWRAQTYIAEHASEVTAHPESMGMILARFHRSTSDLPWQKLPPTVPGFHDTPRYLQETERALAEAPKNGKEEAELRWCHTIIERFRPMARYFAQAEAAGKISRRVTHGDPKRENFIHADNGHALGLFDLDTAGPGFLAHDLGDCLRSLVNPAGEEADFEAIRFDLDICQEFLVGYWREYSARNMSVTGPPFDVFAGLLTIAFELGLRRLADHLHGDRYFRVARHGDNLRLAMVQFRLAKLVAANEQKIRALAST